VCTFRSHRALQLLLGRFLFTASYHKPSECLLLIHNKLQD
jgi:hypothetical protein